MSDVNTNPQRRYRRRIVGWGLFVLVLAFVVPSIFIVQWVHSDLENRVTNELAENGIDGVTVEFSGQDGTLDCAVPLDDPDTVVTIAVDVYGVHSIDLDRSCLAGREPVAVPAIETAEPEAPEPTGSPDSLAVDDSPPNSPPASPPTTSVASTTTAAVEPEVESLVDVARADPQFSQLASLLATADLVDTLGADGPFTLLAPTDAAFDAAFEALGADAFEALTSDPDQLRSILLHHVADGLIRSADFVPGPLMMLDGTDIVIDPVDGGVTFSSGSITTLASDLAQLDIDAANGVIHAIDEVLLPVDVTIDPPADAVTTVARLDNGRLTLAGTVANEEQRAVLLEAARAQVADDNVIDELAVDADAMVGDADVDRLAAAVGALPTNLVTGSATLTGVALAIDGVHTGDDALAALEALATELAAALDIEARSDADEVSARELQDELNEFVRLNPLLFEPNSAELTPEASSVVDQIAARAQRYTGVDITLIGHTDSDGDPVRNQELSEDRATTVLNELVVRGLDAAVLTADGRGATQPVVDDAGVEDKNASRRVEFVVRAQS